MKMIIKKLLPLFLGLLLLVPQASFSKGNLDFNASESVATNPQVLETLIANIQTTYDENNSSRTICFNLPENWSSIRAKVSYTEYTWGGKIPGSSIYTHEINLTTLYKADCVTIPTSHPVVFHDIQIVDGQGNTITPEDLNIPYLEDPCLQRFISLLYSTNITQAGDPLVKIHVYDHGDKISDYLNGVVAHYDGLTASTYLSNNERYIKMDVVSWNPISLNYLIFCGGEEESIFDDLGPICDWPTIDPLTIDCLVNGNDINISVTGGQEPYSLAYEDTRINVVNGVATLSGLSCGEYGITVTDGIGCTAECYSIISSTTTVEQTICVDVPFTLNAWSDCMEGVDLEDVCYKWEPTGLLGTTNETSAEFQATDVPGEHTIQLTITNGLDGSIIHEVTFVINVEYCIDTDGDGIEDDTDPCPTSVDNGDFDNDGIANGCDNCPFIANVDQSDMDEDGDGDVCDGEQDSDGDGLPDYDDPCPMSASNTDTDGDGICDGVDNCIYVANFDQADLDGDGIGDICDDVDNDTDGDGEPDDTDPCPLTPGNIDTDGDGICDEADPDPDNGCIPVNIDTDGDGICDLSDCDPDEVSTTYVGMPCNDYNASTINDVIDNNCECNGTPDVNNPCDGNDQDGDGICDDEDDYPFDACQPLETDSDFDGVCDFLDCNPNNYSLSYIVGDPCDDGNVSTMDDVINSDCQCAGIPDPDQPCFGNDHDGDGICDSVDDFPNDECNGLSAQVSGDLTLCSDEGSTDLTVTVSGGIPPHLIQWETGSSTETTTVNFASEGSDEGIDYMDVEVSITDALGCEYFVEVAIHQYTMPDMDLDGLCDDEPCTVPDILQNATPIDELTSVRFKLNTNDQQKSAIDCDISCSYEPNFPSVCLWLFADIENAGIGTCDVTDPIYELAQQTYGLFHPAESHVIITSNQAFCDCPELNNELTNNWQQDVEYGIWINFTEPDQDNMVSINKIITKPENPGLQQQILGWFDDGVTIDVAPTAGIVHPSQLEGIAYPDYENLPHYQPIFENGISDYAGITPEMRLLLRDMIAKARNRWTMDVKFIISADCPPPVPDGQQAPDPLDVLAQNEFANPPPDNFVVWVHYHSTGQVSFDVEFTYDFGADNVHKKLLEENIFGMAGTDKDIITAEAPEPELTTIQTDEFGDGSQGEYDFGIRDGADENEINFYGLAKEIAGLGKSSLLQGYVDAKVWKPNQDCLFDTPGLLIGPLDAAAEFNPVTGTIQMLNLGKTLYEDPQARKGMIEAIKHPVGTAKKMYTDFEENASGVNGNEIAHHTISKTTVGTVLGAITGVALLGSVLDNWGKKVDDFMNDAKNTLDDFPENLDHAIYNRVKDQFPDEATAKKFLEHLGDLGPLKRKIFINHPDFVNIWQKFNLDGPAELAKFQNVMKQMPEGNGPFLTEFTEVFVKVDGVVDDVKHIIDDLGADPQLMVAVSKPNGVKAWESVFDYPNVRKNPVEIDYINNHVSTTTKTFDDVAEEVPKLGTFSNWKLWNGIWKQTDNLIGSKTGQIKNLYPDASVGYRGSMATGQKFGPPPSPFDPDDFDVDAFIVSDDFAAQFNTNGFRDARIQSAEIGHIADDLEASFISNFPGYRTEPGKPFTFRVWTEAEFQNIVVPNGYKLIE